MKRLPLAWVLLAACGLEHSPDALDAGPPTDTSTIDVGPDGHVAHDASSPPDVDAPCLDVDGDGARDARCGGDDCDDADPNLGPGHSVCSGPTTSVHCEGALRVDGPCPTATPDCDARTNTCAATACGDHVVQPDEECDGPPCNPNCHPWCMSQLDCESSPAGDRCIFPDGYDTCAPSTPGGAPLGTNCTSDVECESSWCDDRTGRCTEICNLNCSAGGGPPTSWCSDTEAWNWGANRAPSPLFIYPHQCDFRCALDSDCIGGRHCTVSRMAADGAAPWMVSATCAATVVGGIPLGGACWGVPEGLGCDSNNCVGGICTVTCLEDADCPAPFSRCVDHDFASDALADPVQPWPAPRICAN